MKVLSQNFVFKGQNHSTSKVLTLENLGHKVLANASNVIAGYNYLHASVADLGEEL